MEFGKKIQMLRKSQGISQETLAAILKINRNNLSRIEYGDEQDWGYLLSYLSTLNTHLTHGSKVYTDCGIEIFNLEEQDVHCGGSGCGCSATVFAGYIYKKLLKKEFNKVMLVSTGALLSPTSTLQKQTIPCVAHAVVIEND